MYECKTFEEFLNAICNYEEPVFFVDLKVKFVYFVTETKTLIIKLDDWAKLQTRIEEDCDKQIRNLTV